MKFIEEIIFVIERKLEFLVCSIWVKDNLKYKTSDLRKSVIVSGSKKLMSVKIFIISYDIFFDLISTRETSCIICQDMFSKWLFFSR